MSDFKKSQTDAWFARFGCEPTDDLPDIGTFLQHRSVRDFSERQVEESTVRALIGAAQSASTSSNLQLWSVITVQDPARRDELTQLCDNQQQVRKAPWVFAFLADHYRLKSAASKFGEQTLGLDYNEYFTMAVIDAALAAERLVCGAEYLGLGVCYIGALRNDPQAVKELFQLPEGVVGLFGLCLGWPKEECSATIKPRLAPESVWFKETYNANVDTAEYDERMKEFYKSQGMNVDVTWTMRSGRRVDEFHLTGRERLKEFLKRQGMDSR